VNRTLRLLTHCAAYRRAFTVLCRCGHHATGWGFTLRGDCDFQLHKLGMHALAQPCKAVRAGLSTVGTEGTESTDSTALQPCGVRGGPVPGRTRIRCSASAHGRNTGARATVGYRAALIQLAIRFRAMQQTARWTDATRCNATLQRTVVCAVDGCSANAAQVHSNFKACYGVDDTGDIYNSANIRDFRSIVMAKTGGTRGTPTQRTRGTQTQRTRGTPTQRTRGAQMQRTRGTPAKDLSAHRRRLSRETALRRFRSEIDRD
jgi:hypothetical protein